MELVADLHMHSTYSDGKYPPPRGSDYHGWDNKFSVTSFGVDANYLNNFTDLLY